LRIPMRHLKPGLRNPLSTAAATALIVAAAVLLGCGSDGSASGRAAFGPGQTGVEIEDGAQRTVTLLRKDFALFRRAATPRDRLPPRLVPPPEAVHRLALDLEAAKLTYGGAINRIYAVPGGRAVCLFDTRGVSSTCWPPATVARGMAVSTSFCPPNLPALTMQMVGLLPDGVRRAWVIMENGRRQPAPVEQNLMLLDLPFGRSLPSRLVWRRGAEIHNQIAGVSPRVAKLSCGSEQ